nr:hypothetical protein [uncultured Flavobacterium sp.]
MKPNFPPLKVSKHRRVMTKHFCNLALWLPSNELALLNFLVYQTDADNTFKYSAHLMKQFEKARIAAFEEYQAGIGFRMTEGLHRRSFINLEQQGLIIRCKKKYIWMLNPLLSYQTDVISVKNFNQIQDKYQTGTLEEVRDLYLSLVAKFLESKKKGYTYKK